MTDLAASTNQAGPRPWWNVGRIALGLILLAALTLRVHDLGRTSLWFDEANTMRMAREPNLTALIARLDKIDGSRAPLHPIVLQAWLRVFGSSDVAGRSFSVVCGLITVWVTYVIGRRAFDDATARWAAWLTAVCPPLVYYARETRMYAWLILLTCLSWLTLLSFRRSANKAQCLTYGSLLTALIYSHPVGFFMVAAHGLAYLLVRSALMLSVRWWLAIQLAVVAAVLPWLRRYLDHGTDYPLPRYPVRFLLAVPIEYVGGNSVALAFCLAIVAFGLRSRRPENLVLITWAAAPPLLMYLYSYVSQPIFGPARYHLFIAPAYLLLLAHGLAKLPGWIRWPSAAIGLALSLSMLQADAFFPGVKADWRGLNAWLTHQVDDASGAGEKPANIAIVIHPSDPRFPHDEIGAALYYLNPRFVVVLDGQPIDRATIYDVHCLKTPRIVVDVDPGALVLHGLVVFPRKAR